MFDFDSVQLTPANPKWRAFLFLSLALSPFPFDCPQQNTDNASLHSRSRSCLSKRNSGKSSKPNSTRKPPRPAGPNCSLFFARGQTIYVAPGLDLVDVAVAFSEDNAAEISLWREKGLVDKVSDTQATQWYGADQTLWSVVVMPWVLVQPEQLQ